MVRIVAGEGKRIVENRDAFLKTDSVLVIVPRAFSSSHSKFSLILPPL